MKPTKHAVVAVWTLIIAIINPSACQESTADASRKCGLYLAPSTIPGAGMGLFVGHETREKDEIVAAGDVVIAVTDIEWHHDEHDWVAEPFLWDQYTWSTLSFGKGSLDRESDDPDYVSGASPGFGAMANGHLTLSNVADEYPILDRLGVNGTSPGGGAMSPYHNREWYAKTTIPAGAEIFLDYGENYFSTRPDTYGSIPLERDYRYADAFIDRFQQIREANKVVDGAIWSELWHLIASESNNWEASRRLQALPLEYDRVDAIMEDGGTSRQYFNESIRDLEWLEEHGHCMDNIGVRKSQIPHAGRGAFARRFIPKGGLVAPAPVIHIPNDVVLNVYQFDSKGAGETISQATDKGDPVTQQVMMNYCFGHPRSTLLLCPYGYLTSYINHSSKSPNAEIQWSKTMRHKEWMEQPIERWGRETHSGLSLDFVALRDIQEGEEVVIDYGELWEEAWQKHVRNFVPRSNYAPAYELNQRLSEGSFLSKSIADPRYQNVQLHCRSWFVEQAIRKPVRHDQECNIIREVGENKFMAQLGQGFYEGVILWSMPPDAFYFEDLPYSRDHQQYDAFRHRMLIPDDMFPSVWESIAPKPST